jgi:hypothetical protein
VLLGPATIVRLKGALHPCLLISTEHAWRRIGRETRGQGARPAILVAPTLQG